MKLDNNLIKQIETTTKYWINGLISNHVDMSVLSDKFNQENGMYLEEYLNDELKKYRSFSNYSDLDNNFTLSIDFVSEIEKNKYLIFYTVFNQFDKAIFKWSLTFDFNNQFLLGGNNYISQIVHKFDYFYEYNCSDMKLSFVNKGIGLSISPNNRYKIKKIISKDFLVGNINQTNDFFKTSITIDSNFQEGEYFFSIFYENENGQILKEKRSFYFSEVYIDKPFIFEDGYIKFLREKYIYSIKLIKNDSTYQNKVYDMDDEILEFNEDTFSKYDKIIITDALDNDWEIKIN